VSVAGVEIMGLLCLAIGVGIVGVGSFRIYLLIASASWQRTMGQVLESSAHQGHEMNVWPSIKYSYMVKPCSRLRKTKQSPFLLRIYEHPVYAGRQMLTRPQGQTQEFEAFVWFAGKIE
jgi:hypothetical protein